MDNTFIFHTGLFSNKAKTAFFVAYDFVVCLKLQREAENDFSEFRDTPFELNERCFVVSDCGQNQELTDVDSGALFKLNSLYCDDKCAAVWNSETFRTNMKWMMDKFLSTLNSKRTDEYGRYTLHWDMHTLMQKALAALISNGKAWSFVNAIKHVFDFFKTNKTITETDFNFVRDFFDDDVNLIEKYGADFCDKMIGKPKNQFEIMAEVALNKQIDVLVEEKNVKIKEIKQAYMTKKEVLFKKLEEDKFNEIRIVMKNYSDRINALRAEYRIN